MKCLTNTCNNITIEQRLSYSVISENDFYSLVFAQTEATGKKNYIIFFKKGECAV